MYNIGTGKDITIKELAETIQKVTGHQGNILWDANKPDGTPRKLMDVSKMKEWMAIFNRIRRRYTKNLSMVFRNIDTIKEIKL